MKNLQKIMVIVVLLVIVLSVVACDGGGVGNADDWKQDYNTAWDDSGLDTAAGAVDNLLVGSITGKDYTEGTR